jgi:acetylornithine deacetylase/succinyl-diaminopimelate desuccinylase-like protein
MRARVGLALLAILAAEAQSPPAAARQWRQSHERPIVEEFLALLAIPNVARNVADMRRNAAHIGAMFARRGIATRLLEAGGAPPAIFGEIKTPGATQTIVFYAHYDGQPVEPSQWASGDPFRPELRDAALDRGGRVIPLPEAGKALDPEWRIYARSAGDDKAPIVAWLAALDALRAARIPLRSNLKFFLDGEEEAGSRHLEAIVKANRELLAGDVWIFCDGPVHQNRTQQIAFGARGVTGVNLTVYGPGRELHSGHYGKWAPNPAMMLAQLVGSMKDADGRVLIEGFYDRVEPLSETEKRAIAQAPGFDEELKRELWLARTENGGRRLDELINLPGLNVRGLASAGVGPQSRNVIPASATASIDIRLVKGLDHGTAVRLLLEHVKRQGYFVAAGEPDEATRQRHPRVARVESEGGYNAVRTSMDLEISRRILRAVESARGPVIRLPTLGGSLPLAAIVDTLQVPFVIVPIANHDNNQHGHNENMRIQNLWDGIETMAALLAM